MEVMERASSGRTCGREGGRREREGAEMERGRVGGREGERGGREGREGERRGRIEGGREGGMESSTKAKPWNPCL